VFGLILTGEDGSEIEGTIFSFERVIPVGTLESGVLTSLLDEEHDIEL
jgi:hypothetical protein